MFDHFDYRKMRKIGLATAWCMVLFSLFLMDGVYASQPFGPPAHQTSFIVVLGDFLGVLIGFSPEKMWWDDRLKYILRETSGLLTALAHVYFLCSFFIISIPTWPLLGRILRYAAVVLLFIWTYPIFNYFHPLAVDFWRLEEGFYVLGLGYTLAMVCIVWGPRQPERRRGFPVV